MRNLPTMHPPVNEQKMAHSESMVSKSLGRWQDLRNKGALTVTTADSLNQVAREIAKV
jgi:hypothetical protein